MLVQPKFKIMTPEQADDYYKRITQNALQNEENGIIDSYFSKVLKRINKHAVNKNITINEACIDLNQISIGDTDSDDIKEIETGIYVGNCLNIEREFDYDLSLSFRNLYDSEYLNKSGYNSYPSEFDYKIPFDYGVCDTPEQFLNYKYIPGDWGRYILNKLKIEITDDIEKELDNEITLGDYLKNSDKKFAIFFTKMEQDLENKGKGGGWRWHKWGQYIGKHNIQCEYLDDEDLSDINQDYILCFHIYEFKDAEPVEDKETK